jgi:N-acetylmuramoyl-L-alanine amidase
MPRVYPFILGSALMLSVMVAVFAAESSLRAAPARPGGSSAASSAARPAAVKTLTLSQVATKLGLKITWPKPVTKATLADATRRLELEVDSREARINGVRVFLGNPITRHRGEILVNSIDFETCLVPLLKPSLIPLRLQRPKIIAIDAGHGGVDHGTENRRLEYKEKTFTLDVSLRLKALLEKQGYTVVLTRAKDVTIDKPMRVILANRAGADLFVSIHFNSLANDTKTRGTEVFTFAPKYQRSTNSWGPLEPDDTETELSPGNHYDAWNSLLAHSMHRELLDRLKTFDRGKKIAHLGVLRGLECPGVLIESGFLSNDEEARLIATPGYRQQIAAALAAGIDAYADKVSPVASKP